jgi:hypothetical protein
MEAFNVNYEVSQPSGEVYPGSIEKNDVYSWMSARCGRMSCLGGNEDPATDDGRGLLMLADIDLNGHSIRNSGGGGGGESNTASSAGGESLVLPKSGVDLPFKGLTSDASITLTANANDIEISVDDNEVLKSLDGIVVGDGVSALTAKKSKFNEAVPPTINRDTAEGYVPGSRWLDTTADKEYVCLDNAAGAAVWKETTSSGGGAAVEEWDAVVIGAGGDASYTFNTLQEAVTANKSSIRVTANTGGALLLGGISYHISVTKNAVISTTIDASSAKALTWVGGQCTSVDPIRNDSVANDDYILLEDITFQSGIVHPSTLPVYGVRFVGCFFSAACVLFGVVGSFHRCEFVSFVTVNRDFIVDDPNLKTNTSFYQCKTGGSLTYADPNPGPNTLKNVNVIDCEIGSGVIITGSLLDSTFRNNRIVDSFRTTELMGLVWIDSNRIDGDLQNNLVTVGSNQVYITNNRVEGRMDLKFMAESVITGNYVKGVTNFIDEFSECKMSQNHFVGALDFIIAGTFTECTFSDNTCQSTVISRSAWIDSNFTGNTLTGFLTTDGDFTRCNILNNNMGTVDIQNNWNNVNFSNNINTWGITFGDLIKCKFISNRKTGGDSIWTLTGLVTNCYFAYNDGSYDGVNIDNILAPNNCTFMSNGFAILDKNNVGAQPINNYVLGQNVSNLRGQGIALVNWDVSEYTLVNRP